MDLVFFIFLIITLIVLSGIVSGSEAALLSISYTKTKEIVNSAKKKRKKKAEKLLFIKENLKNYITTLVIFNNVINIVGSIYVGVLAAQIFGEAYLGLISGIITFLIIMFSEIIPKIYGEKHSEKISVNIASTLILLTKILIPFIFILNKISGFFIKEKKIQNHVSEGEIKEMAVLGHKEGSINSYESEVIRNVFRMNDIEVYDIMVPKNKVEILDIETSFEDVVKIAESTGYTRFPISRNSEVIGLINIKDLFRFNGKEEKFTISKILRPITYAPEMMKLLTLQEKFKKDRVHMAAIVNEHGDLTGIVTLEDIIEELLGDIEDEFDFETDDGGINKINENKYIINGDVDFDKLNNKFVLNVNIKEDFTTLNGFLISKLDKIPKVNDIVKLEKGIFRVIKASKRKVLEVEFTLKDY